MEYNDVCKCQEIKKGEMQVTANKQDDNFILSGYCYLSLESTFSW